MPTYYLRFPSEDVFRTAASIAGLRDEMSGGNYIQYTHDHAMDIIGTISSDELPADSNSGQPDATSAWHVNFMGSLPAKWEQYLVHPSNPYRVFA
jgi:hypothetical protein